jgi:hypothetical protein
MRVLLANGYAAEIFDGGRRLNIFGFDGGFAFSVEAPEFSTFVAFAEHATEGRCPLLSYEVDRKQNGWMDWYCKIDMQSRSVRLLNPWR